MPVQSTRRAQAGKVRTFGLPIADSHDQPQLLQVLDHHRSVAVSYPNWRSASATPGMYSVGLQMRPNGFAKVELLTFQTVIDAADGDGCGSPRFADLLATGSVRTEDAEQVMRDWCERGEIPVHFQQRGVRRESEFWSAPAPAPADSEIERPRARG